MSHLRADFTWASIEPERGQFDFERFDRFVDVAAENGQEVLALLVYGNRWATSQSEASDMFPPDDPEDYARYVAETVAHFRGRVGLYEIWNEQNAGVRFWRGTLGGDPRAYGELLKRAYAAAKRADPQCVVSFGGLFGPDFFVVPGAERFLEDVFAAHPDIASYFDTMAFHPYRYPFTAPESDSPDQPSLVATIRSLRSLLASHGAGEKEVWITEVGWHTAVLQPLFTGVSYRDQARYFVRSFVLALSEGVTKFVWYTLEDGPHPWVWQEEAFGIYGEDPDPSDGAPPPAKPARDAFTTLARVLGDMSFGGATGPDAGWPEGTLAFRFSRPDGRKRVRVVWHPWGTDVPIRLSVARGAAARRVEMLGEESEITTSEVEIVPGSDPVYLVEEMR